MSEISPSAPHYRPDIDGMRAIAVLAVILNHIDHRLAPSGYLGVDIFFVISGYVITLSLWQRSASDLKSFLLDFYARRFRRILPALILCVAVTGLAAWLVDPESRISLLTGLTALIGASNLYLLSISADYFAQTTALNFLTHTWSLGVEEQFYLAFPFLIWFTIGRPNRERRTLGILLAVSAISIALLFIIPGARGGAAYFLPFGRLWELALGAIMALLPWTMPRIAASLRHPTIQLFALAMLLTVLFLPVPPSAVWALLAVPPTAILMLGSATDAWPGKALAIRPLRWTGAISYSLYLWHWPVIALSLMLFRPTPRLAAIQFAVTFLLAIATYFAVERPFREKLPSKGSARFFGRFALVLGGCGALLAACLVIPNPTPLGVNFFGRMPVAFPDWPGSPSRHERDCVIDGAKKTLAADTMAKCTLPPLSAERPTVWVMGDSHAGHLRGLLAELRAQTGFGIHLVETPGIAFPVQAGSSFPPREALFAQTHSLLKKGDIIVLARLLFERDAFLQPVSGLDAWIGSVAEFARRMEPLGVKVVVMGPLPMFRYTSIARCRPDAKTGRTDCDEPRAPLAQATADMMERFESAAKQVPNLSVFDSFAALCPPAHAMCSPVRQRVPLYRDKDHLNAAGSAALTEAFVAFLKREK